MKTYAFMGKLTKTKRRNNSFFGNPAWTLFLEYDGEVIEAKTASNAACGYSVSNYKIGDLLKIKGHYTKTGNFIIDYILD